MNNHSHIDSVELTKASSNLVIVFANFPLQIQRKASRTAFQCHVLSCFHCFTFCLLVFKSCCYWNNDFNVNKK